MAPLISILKTTTREEGPLGTIVETNNKVGSRVRMNRIKLTEVKKLKNLTNCARFNFSGTGLLIPKARDYKRFIPIF